jgi:hypothetical protein
MDSICKCNNCEGVFVDTNPQVGANIFNLGSMFIQELEDHSCPNCGVDDYLSDMDSLDEASFFWNILGDIPVNEEDEIEEEFLGFKIGTDKFEIWHWFEEKFDLSVAKDLMNLD